MSTSTRMGPIMASRRRRRLVGGLLSHAFLLATTAILLFPLFYMLSRSLMEPSEINTLPPVLWPRAPQWQNYVVAFSRAPFFTFLLNTLKIVVLSVIGITGSAALCGYAFARMSFPGRNALFAAVLATLMLPGAVTMIPLYVIFRDLGWLNTHYPLWLPGWFGGGAVNIFLFRQFFRTLPRELDEAAIIDGANPWQIFSRVALPLCLPVVAVVATFTALASWTDILGPAIYLNTEEKFTLAQGLYNVFRTSYYGTTQVQFVMAVGFLFVIPPLLLFVFMQRYLIEGIATTGFK